MILASFALQITPIFLIPSLQSIGLLAQKKQLKIDLQDGSHLGFVIKLVFFFFFFFFFYLQVAPILPTSFMSVGLFVQEKFKIDFQDGSHLGYLI